MSRYNLKHVRYRKNMKQMRYLFPLLLATSALQAADWDVEYWQYFNWKNWEKDRCMLYTTGEVRLRDEMTAFYFYRITENFRYRALSNLDLEIHYSAIEDKPKNAKYFRLVQRLELEANPFYRFDNDVRFKWRNRFEFIKTEYFWKITTVFRHQFMITFPMHNCGPLKSISCFDEIFYNMTNKQLTQNRFTPIELTYQLTRKLTIAPFLTFRCYRAGLHWYRSAVIGTKLGF